MELPQGSPVSQASAKDLEYYRQRVEKIRKSQAEYRKKVVNDPIRYAKRLESCKVSAKKYRANAKAKKAAELAEFAVRMADDQT